MHGSPYNKRSGIAERRPSEGAAATLDALRRLVQMLRSSTVAVERQLGISGAQLFVLRKLAEAGRRSLSINELAERTLTHQSSVSTVVSKLAERGLVQRERAGDDARRVKLSLSAAGRAMLSDAPETAQDRIVKVLAAMPDQRREKLASLLGELVERIGLPSAPEMFLESQYQSGKRSRRGRQESSGD